PDEVAVRDGSQLRHCDLHDAALVAPALGQRRDDLFDDGTDFVGRFLSRQIGLENLTLAGFFGDQLGTAGLLELRDRVAPLLDLFANDLERLVVGQLVAGLDLTIGKARERAAQGIEAHLISGFHRFLQIGADLVANAHGYAPTLRTALAGSGRLLLTANAGLLVVL